MTQVFSLQDIEILKVIKYGRTNTRDVYGKLCADSEPVDVLARDGIISRVNTRRNVVRVLHDKFQD